MTTTWHQKPDSILLNKQNGTLVLKVGQFITYKGREMGVRIEQFTYSEAGPIGMIYLPWRGDRWATPVLSISHGNPRHIICFPEGLTHYGQHIQWNTVELMNDGICPDFKVE